MAGAMQFGFAACRSVSAFTPERSAATLVGPRRRYVNMHSDRTAWGVGNEVGVAPEQPPTDRVSVSVGGRMRGLDGQYRPTTVATQVRRGVVADARDGCLCERLPVAASCARRFDVVVSERLTKDDLGEDVGSERHRHP